MTFVALDSWRETSTILEENYLFFVVERLLHQFCQEVGEKTINFLLSCGVFHVDAINIGQSLSAKSMFHLYEGILAGLCVVVGFDAGCGAAQYGAGVPYLGQVGGGVASVVARGGFVLFERIVVLFVDDNQSEVAEGKEECATCTKKYVEPFVWIIGYSAVPNLGSLARAESRMINSDAIAKIFA